MALLDYIIFIFGIYGIAWTITQSKLLSKPVSYLQEKSLFLNELLSCIVCTSFWVSIPFCHLYFVSELWFTKVLICFSQVSFTWILALFLGDLDE
jgi:hypothetical protein